MKHKLLKLALLSSIPFALISCTKEKKTVSLNIWTYYNGNIETSFQEIIEEFNKTRGASEKIVVSSISQGSQVSDLSNALLASAKGEAGSDTMPDLFISYADTAYELNNLGKLASLDNYFTTDDLSLYNSDFLKEGYINNSLKILPVSKSTEALYINKTDFDKFINSNPDLNITYSSLSTIEGLIDVSEKYYLKTGKAFFGRDSLDNYFVVGAKMLGIDILSYGNTNTLSINYDHDVFKKLWDSYYVPYVKGYFDSVGKFRSADIEAGTILAYIGSTASANYFPDKVYLSDTVSYSIEPLILETPSFEGREKVAVSQGAGFCITKSTKEKEEASSIFLKWLSEYDNVTKFSKSSGYFPSTKLGLDDNFIQSQSSEILKQNFTVCKNTVNNYKMYTNIVGTNGTTYRNYLKESLLSALSSAKKQVEVSTNKAETISTLTSDQNFETWFETLKKNKTK